MKRTLIALIAAVGLVGFAGSAGAAIISMSTDAATYTVGDTITLTITGDSQGATAGLQARVITMHDLGLVSANGAQSFNPAPNAPFTQFGGALPPTVGGQQGNCAWALGRDSQCLVFDQIFASSASPADAGPRTAVFTYLATGAGVASFSFVDAIASDFVFFDIANPPAGVSVTINPIPEPTTAALLGLGLFGLALGGRRR